ncbi:Uncharacterised protein [Salmonella enterica subsp. enterica]|uniref:Uncharacterized protein n=1 Tax=Salmonella enterica I TaxID=59201 RepID=A0A3S4HXM0_SALET|nr:Uncharacterised protein [Salmonella enterica subsp. enterica]
MPPSWARAIARRASVTVSIAAEKHRNIQTNSFRQLRAEIGSIRQNGGVSGNKEDVVKRQSFFSDT